MMTLIGGKYDGRTIDRDPIPLRATLAIIDNGDHEVYRMEPDGNVHHVDAYHRMDSAARPSDLC